MLADAIPTLPGVDPVISTAGRHEIDIARELRHALVDRGILASQ